MATFIVDETITITRKEGNTADIEILLGEEMELEGNEVVMQVYDKTNRLVFEKTNADWTRDDYTANPDDPADFSGTIIRCLLSREDTNNKPGNHFFELYLTNAKRNPHYIIAEGPFVILPNRSKTL